MPGSVSTCSERIAGDQDALDGAAGHAFSTQRRTGGETKTGHSRFITENGIRVPATPKARRGSAPNQSRLPVSATPTL